MKTFKNAFTMLELIFVLVVIGILAVVMIPRMGRDTLSEAAIQVAAHIRYTQHLAMNDDRYTPSSGLSNETDAAQNTQYWYLGRWQVKFSTASSTISYSIMADTSRSNYDGNPNATLPAFSEVARDPLDSDKYLIGVAMTSFDSGNNAHINSKLDLKKSYNVGAVSITGGGTGSSAKRIIFDHFGRVYRGDTKKTNATRIQNPVDKLATSKIAIKLCTSSCSDPKNKINNSNERLIVIHPQTGFVNVLYNIGDSA